MPCKSLQVGLDAKLLLRHSKRAFRSEEYASYYNLIVADCEYLYGDTGKVLHAKCDGGLLALSPAWTAQLLTL